WIGSALGVVGEPAPGRPCRTRLERIWCPIASGDREAPTTAIVRGLRIASRPAAPSGAAAGAPTDRLAIIVSFPRGPSRPAPDTTFALAVTGTVLSGARLAPKLGVGSRE